MIDHRIRFEERYDSEEYKTTTLYYVADISLLKEFVGNKYPEADGMTISIECPMNCLEACKASVEISPYEISDNTVSDYDWVDIYLPYEEIEELINMALTAESEKKMKSRYEKQYGYTYESMITAQDEETVSELTEGVFTHWNDKLETMGSICDFYEYLWRFFPDGRLVLTSLDSNDEDCDWKGETYSGHHEYLSLDEMLSDWLTKIDEADKKYFIDEIQFIKENIK